jgi:hypothetical protein
MRIKPMIMTALATGALVGGGAAIADAASSSSPTTKAPTPNTSTTDTPSTGAQSTPAPTPPRRRSGHNCPHMGNGGPASQGSFEGPAGPPSPHV